jgi:Holliday junction resolvase
MDAKKQQENQEKGDDAEKAFAKYLDEKKITFFHIDQNKDDFHSAETRTNKIHRPDFIAHTKIGVFHIDVKFRTKKEFGETGETRFYLNQYELQTLFNFSGALQSEVWIAFIGDLDSPVFYYAPISSIYQYYSEVIDVYAKNFFDEYEKYSEVVWIFIPPKLLYDNFSSEKGFLKNHETDFIKNEVENYRAEAKKIDDPKKIKWANINAHKKQQK